VRNEELSTTRETVKGLEEESREKEREMRELQVNLQEAQQQNREKTRILDSLQVQLAGRQASWTLCRSS
jgi:septal ring factor EnvC (AmiA/AmiB activator)